MKKYCLFGCAIILIFCLACERAHVEGSITTGDITVINATTAKVVSKVSLNASVKADVLFTGVVYSIDHKGLAISVAGDSAINSATAQIIEIKLQGGVLNTTITNLQPAEKYYIRAFVVFKVDGDVYTFYGEIKEFETKQLQVSIVRQAIENKVLL